MQETEFYIHTKLIKIIILYTDSLISKRTVLNSRRDDEFWTAW
jgi:hypothetical protein